MKREYLWPAVKVGIGLSLVMGLIYIVPVWLWWWPVLWGYPPSPDLSANQITQLTLHLAYGQVYTGAVAVFLAGFLGWYAIREFAETQARPRLSVAFHPYGKPSLKQEPQTTVSDSSISEPYFSLTVYNDGPVVAVWFIVTLHVPFLPASYENVPLLMRKEEFFSVREEGQYCPVMIEAGGAEENWRWQWDMERHEFILSFLSNGTIAAYPGVPLTLCTFWLMGHEVRRWGPSGCEYVIGMERSQPEHGALHVDLKTGG